MKIFDHVFKLRAERRPCMVNGRRAMFHRWADSARPVTPRDLEEEEMYGPRYQLYSVHGIVEFEDGTVQRVWPSDIRFIDGGDFADYVWPEEEYETD